MDLFCSVEPAPPGGLGEGKPSPRSFSGLEDWEGGFDRRSLDASTRLEAQGLGGFLKDFLPMGVFFLITMQFSSMEQTVIDVSTF